MKRVFSIFLVMLMVSILVACNSTVNKNNGQNAVGTSKTNDAKEVTLRIYNFKVEIAEPLERLKVDYQNSHPGVKLEIETVLGSDYNASLKTKFAAGEGPDIFNNGGYKELETWKTQLEDLSDQPWVSEVVEVAKAPMMSDGKLYGMPVSLEGYGFVYNKNLFEKAGITKLPATLTELEEASKKLQAIGVTPFVNMYQNSLILGGWYQNSAIAKHSNVDKFLAGLNDGTSSFVDDPILQDSLKLLDLTIKYGNKNQLSTDYNNGVSLFLGGQYAMMLNGNWINPTVQKVNPDFKIGLMPMPINDDTAMNDKLFVGVPNNWVINKNSKAKKEAKEFLNWLVSSDTGRKYLTKDFAFIPAMKNIEANPADIGSLGMDVSNYVSQNKALGWNWVKFPEGAVDEFATSYQKYIAAKINRKQIGQEFQATWDRLKKF